MFKSPCISAKSLCNTKVTRCLLVAGFFSFPFSRVPCQPLLYSLLPLFRKQNRRVYAKHTTLVYRATRRRVTRHSDLLCNCYTGFRVHSISKCRLFQSLLHSFTRQPSPDVGCRVDKVPLIDALRLDCSRKPPASRFDVARLLPGRQATVSAPLQRSAFSPSVGVFSPAPSSQLLLPSAPPHFLRRVEKSAYSGSGCF